MKSLSHYNRAALCAYILLFSSFSLKAERINSSSSLDSFYSDFSHRYFYLDEDPKRNEDDIDIIRRLYKEISKGDLISKAKITSMEAMYHCFSNPPDYDKSILLANEALPVLTKEKYPQDYIKLLLVKSIGSIYKGNLYMEAYQYLNEALEMKELEKDTIMLANVYSHIALLWRELRDYDNALQWCKRSEDLFKEAGYIHRAYIMQSNATTIYVRMGNHSMVTTSIQEILPWIEVQCDTVLLTYLNTILGKSYLMMNELDSAYFYFNRGLELIEEYQHPLISRKTDALFSLGKLFYLKEDYQQSLSYFSQLLQEKHHSNLLRYEGETYAILSEIEEIKGNTKEALFYHKQSVNAKDSLAIEEQAHELQRIKSHAELNNYHQQLEITKQNAKLKQVRFLSVTLILLLILIVIIFILFYINRKKKLKEMEYIQLAQSLQNKEIKSQLEKIELENRIENQNREMTTTQLLVTEKNKILEQILNTFKPYYENNKISVEMWKEIKTLVSSSQQKEDAWDKSKVHFEKVHPGFFKKLKEMAPALGESELRIAAYIRIGMRTKQIADMLSIDDRSVIVSRYRIKKKLNLEKEISLDEFMRNL